MSVLILDYLDIYESVLIFVYFMKDGWGQYLKGIPKLYKILHKKDADCSKHIILFSKRIKKS